MILRVLTILLLISCSEESIKPDHQIHPVYQPYYDLFMGEVSRQGKTVKSVSLVLDIIPREDLGGWRYEWDYSEDRGDHWLILLPPNPPEDLMAGPTIVAVYRRLSHILLNVPFEAQWELYGLDPREPEPHPMAPAYYGYIPNHLSYEQLVDLTINKAQ